MPPRETKEEPRRDRGRTRRARALPLAILIAAFVLLFGWLRDYGGRHPDRPPAAPRGGRVAPAGTPIRDRDASRGPGRPDTRRSPPPTSTGGAAGAARVIEGRVMESAGAAAPFALVRWWPRPFGALEAAAPWDAIVTTAADEQGRFRLVLPSEASGGILAAASPGAGTALRGTDRPAAVAPDAPFDIALDPPARFALAVLDATGRPVSAARVTVLPLPPGGFPEDFPAASPDSWPHVEARGHTDDRGEVRFEAISPGAKLLAIEAAGQAAVARELGTEGAASAAPAEIRLPAPRRISGILSPGGGAGTPLPRTRIALRQAATGLRSIRPDAGGAFTAHVAASETVMARFFVLGVPAGPWVPVEGDAPRLAAPAVAVPACRVVHERRGDPVAEFRARIRPDGSAAWVSADPEIRPGHVRFPALPPGAYEIEIAAAILPAPRRAGIDLAAGGTEIEVRLPEGVTRRGTVLHPDGATPLHDADVTFQRLDGEVLGATRTGRDGSFELGHVLPEGILKVRHPLVAESAWSLDPSSPEDGTFVADPVFRLAVLARTEDGSAAGRRPLLVLDRTGRLHRIETSEVGLAEATGLPEGEVLIADGLGRAWIPDDDATFLRSDPGARRFRIAAGSSARSELTVNAAVDVEIAIAGGAAAPGTRVHLLEAESAPAPRRHVTVLDPGGRGRIAAILRGRYTTLIESRDRVRSAGPIVIEEGGLVTLRFPD